MANIFHEETADGKVLMAEIAGFAFPFRYLTGAGVGEVIRVCMGLDPLCVNEARGNKDRHAEGSGFSALAGKLLTPEGLEWARKNRPGRTRIERALCIPEVAPDESEEPEEFELQRLMAEQKMDLHA